MLPIKGSLRGQYLNKLLLLQHHKQNTRQQSELDMNFSTYFLKIITKASLPKSFHRKGTGFGRVEKQTKALGERLPRLRLKTKEVLATTTNSFRAG